MLRPAALLMLLPLVAPAADLLVGAAQVDITPAKGTPMAGYYSQRAAEGTHDPLFARALVIEHDGTKVALVALDLIHTTFGMTAESRKLVEADTKIPGGHVMLFASHAHTGPTLAEGGTYAAATGGGSALAKAYMTVLPKKVAEAVAKADAAKKPAKVHRGVGREEKLAFNRRFHMTDGTVGWNPGKLNPKVLKPAGPTDDSVPVVQFVTADKEAKVIATYVNFSMHADTVGGLYFSADYMGVLAEALAKVHGEQAVTLFGLGCCGDVNHINVNSDRPQKGHAEAARIGGRLAGEVLRVLDNARPVDVGPLVVSGATVDLELPKVTDDELDFAKGVVKEVLAEAKPAPKFLDQVQAFKAVDVRERLGKPTPAEVQVISLGRELAWVSLPGEIFTDLGLQIKDGSPFKQTMLNELANGSVGYVPTKLAYSQGNYEVISARVAEGGGEKLVAEAAKQLRARFK
jgi:neutral ceramidase